MLRFKQFVVWLIVAVFIAAAIPIHAAPPPPWPTKAWARSTPEEQGMDSVALAEFIEQVPKLGDVDSLIVVRNGYVVAEAYWHPFQSELTHELMSASKSVISALVGIAIDKGYIKSLDQKMLDFFPGIEIKNLDDNKRAMTLRHLLTMTSGFRCDITQGTDPLGDLIHRPDAAQFGLGWIMADKPGTTWRYCQINVYLLSAILTKTTGKDTLRFARENLFTPLGITDVNWNSSAESLALGYVGLMLNTQDMAKLGYLFLNNGRWEDKQIVPANWVKESIQNYAPQNPFGVPNLGYGYLWWTFDSPSVHFFEANGAYFQRIDVSADKSLVMAATATDMQLSNEGPIFITALLDTVKSDKPLPPNPLGVARLEAAVQAAAHPKPQPVAALPDLAAQISGRTYDLTTPDLQLADVDVMQLPEKDWRIATLGFDFGKDSATLRLQTVSGIRVSVPIGLDGVYRVTPSHFGPLAARGKWEDEMRFAFYLRRLEQGPVLRYSLKFSEGEVSGTVLSARRGDVFAPAPSVLTGQLMPLLLP